MLSIAINHPGSVVLLLRSFTRHIMNKITLLSGFLQSREIEAEIEQYIAYKTTNAPTMALSDRPTLIRFARFSGVRTVSEIRVEHVQKFLQELNEQMATQYALGRARMALRGFLRYHHRRGYMCPSPLVVSKHCRFTNPDAA